MRLALHCLGMLVCGTLLVLGITLGRITNEKIVIYSEMLTANIIHSNYYDHLKLNCAAQKECVSPAFISLNSYNSSWSVLEKRLKDTECSSYFCIADLAKDIGKKAVPDKNYNRQYSDPSDFFTFVADVKDAIPPGNGFIVPPHMNSLRDIFHDYDIFFVDKDDGNLILGGKNIGAIVSSRMRLLLGDSYGNMAPLTSGLFEQHMRARYSKLKSNDFHRVKEVHPAYHFVIVESTNALDLELVVSSRSFLLYKL